MSNPTELSPSDLYRRCNPASLPFQTSDELADTDGVVGQPRAVAAIEFGVGMVQRGYNIFAHGPPGTGRHSIVTRYLEREAATRPPPPDLCYVHNFAQPHAPNLLAVPAGIGARLQRDMERFVDELTTTITNAFEGEEYQSRRHVIDNAFKERSRAELQALEQRAKGKGLLLVPTPVGFTFIPGKDGEVLSDEEFAALPEEQKTQLQDTVDQFNSDLQRTLQQIPRWDRERREQVRKLNREVTHVSIAPLLEELRETYAEQAEILEHLKAVEADVLDNARAIPRTASGSPQSAAEAAQAAEKSSDGPAPTKRYRVNLLVDHSGTAGAPVVFEDNPTHENIVGRIEHHAKFGTFTTDFTLLKHGALHRANGGFLILEAHKVLRQPYAWETLKRALQSRTVRIEPLGQAAGLLSTVSLDPEPLDLDVRVVLIGEPTVYYLLCAYDPDFPELFKVAADFDDRIDADDGNQEGYLRLLGMLIRQDRLHPFDSAAMARLLEHSYRIAGDQEKLSAQMNVMSDLLREADFWAGKDGADTVGAAHVQRAIESQDYRADRARERMREAVQRDTLRIDTSGATVGQVNALSVLSMGTFAFGQPSRITARVRLGTAGVVDIEREVELGGPIHSKGVLILAGYLGGRYAPDHPLSLSASLVFEQSYGGVEGDSASAAELFALLSGIAEVPVKQCFAVTGSVNQRGEIQAIGGVNEKIEGFFDVCRDRELDGTHGAIVPRANVRHLMLRHDVVDAVAAGRFHIHAISTVDEGIELLTGLPAPDRAADGTYPAGTFNALVDARLAALAERQRAFRAGHDGTPERTD